MKRGLLIPPLLAIMAGVASAQMLQAPAAPSATSPVTTSAPARAPVKAAAELPPPPRPEAAPARISQTVVPRQAPVPMLLTKRPPAALAPVATGTQAVSADSAMPQFGETEARAAIEADGYKRPRMMNKGADGTWHARAFRGATEVSLRVDAQGHVTGE